MYAVIIRGEDGEVNKSDSHMRLLFELFRSESTVLRGCLDKRLLERRWFGRAIYIWWRWEVQMKTRERLLQIINENIETQITMEQSDKDLTEVGVDSIAFIRIIVAIEETFECEIPDSKLMISEMNTMGKMWEVIEAIE